MPAPNPQEMHHKALESKGWYPPAPEVSQEMELLGTGLMQAQGG